jgi:nucleoside-diphosphate-sugar epimerase
MRILVTGAAGFVGSELVRRLAAGSNQVTGVDRDSDRLAELARRVPGISIECLDIGSRDLLPALLGKARPEGLIHLAWYANPVDYLTSHANVDSLQMTVGLVDAALQAGCRRLVMGGSCVEYAAQDRLLVESDPPDPQTLYGVCKHSAWQISRVLSREAGADLAWARIFHIHGPGEDRRRLLPWAAGQLKLGAAVPLTDGSQVRDHLHVADVASALATILESGTSGLYNVSSGEPVRLRHVLETLGDLMGARSQLQFGALPRGSSDMMFLAGDSSRLRSLGWSPKFNLREGLANALEGYF